MLIARVSVTARLRVRLRARVISSAACRWFSCGWLQVGQLCLAAVEVGLGLRARFIARGGPRVIARERLELGRVL
jgi:hypothetical protein